MKNQKTCVICERTRPVHTFPKSGKYPKPYCRPCYNAYQSQRGKIDRAENRKLTIQEFKEVWLPLLVEAGDAPWADWDYKTTDQILNERTDPSSDVPIDMTEEEGMIRHNAIVAELLRIMPSGSPD